MKPTIDWVSPAFPAFCFTVMFFTAYGGDWIGASSFLLIGWTDLWLSMQKEKALPRRTYLV